MKRIGVVNRGEAAVRFLNALDTLRRERPDAPEAVVLFTEPDADALCVRLADHTTCIGDGRGAYLDAEVVVNALRATGCEGAWLGWGFASEDAAFAEHLEAAGILVLGPRSETMAALGDKIAAKTLAEANGVPVAPWAVVEDVEGARAFVEIHGLPVLLKAASGGGGRGIRRVDRVEDLDELLVSVRDEVRRSFAGGGVMIECLVEGARHLEVQILGDGAGCVAVIGMRDCSLQRRRQKVIEECPAPHLSAARIEALETAAQRLCEAVRYRSAGTVEFLYDVAKDEAYFLEVNTRLQVEHPITEEVYGVDLVRAQIDLALGASLETVCGEVRRPRGWAFEARVCAEDVRAGYLPSPGRLTRFVLPSGPGLRVDTGFTEGDLLSAEFDPLIAKVIAWGPSRGEALARLGQALERTRIVLDGGRTNLDQLRALVVEPAVREGAVRTDLVESLPPVPAPDAGWALVAAAIDRFLASGDGASGDDVDRHRVEAGRPLRVYRTGPDHFKIVGSRTIDGEGDAVDVRWLEGGACERFILSGARRIRIERAPGDTTYLVDGIPYRVAAVSGGAVTAPTLALVLSVPVRPGDLVVQGQRIAVLESMKMEVRVDAQSAGRVSEVRVAAGAQVRANQVLVVIEPEGDCEREPVDVVALPQAAPSEQEPSERLTAAVVGWDLEPRAFEADLACLNGEGAMRLLAAFADVAELFERRPGQNDLITPAVTIETMRRRGPDALASARRIHLASALAHHGVGLNERSVALHDALQRIERAGANAAITRAAAVAALAHGEALPIRLLDRLSQLDPGRFQGVRDAAEQARYRLFDKPAVDRLAAQSSARAEALVEALMRGEVGFDELFVTAESLLTALGPRAVEVSGAVPEVAAEAVARRLEWSKPGTSSRRIECGPRAVWRFGEGGEGAIAGVCRPDEVSSVMSALMDEETAARLTLLVVPEAVVSAPGAALDALVEVSTLTDAPWSALCLIDASGAELCVRRYDRSGHEQAERRDILPATERRFDLERLARFDAERLECEGGVVLFLARAKEQPDDVRLLAFAEVRSLRRRPGRPLHLPDVDRVFHTAVRAIQAARRQHDPRRRLQWNRLTMVLRPVVPLGPKAIHRYVVRLAPAAGALGLEKVVVRARFTDANAVGGVTPWMDLSIANPSGHRPEFGLRKASHRPLMPRTKYESMVVAARRRGLVYPYEIIAMLKGGGALPPGEFDEWDLNSRGAASRVKGRTRGKNSAGIVFGVIRTRARQLDDLWTRVLVLSDPTRQMGAVAEPECRRIIAALDLAERLGVPLEWVAVSAGARIDWDTGTENLDWTARVLARIVKFTQRGGEINVVVPGLCVGAQAYWNAMATMMMHCTGLLVMTDRGAMVLTGKRALDVSGCVSATDDLALGGFSAIMGPNGQAQAHAPDLGSAYRLLYRHYQLTYAAPGAMRPPRARSTDSVTRDICVSPYPTDLGHGFSAVGQIFSVEHNAERKRPFAVRPLMQAVVDRDHPSLERWGALRGGETAVVWEARVGGHAVTLVGIDNQPVARLGGLAKGGPETFAGGTLYPQASRKVARALNASSGKRPVVVLANLSGFDGSPESLRGWQLEYGAEIGRAVVNFEGKVIFVICSRYHGGAYVVFSKALNPGLVAVALEGSYASVIGGAPAAAVVFAGEVRRLAQASGGGDAATADAVAQLAAKFDRMHCVERAKKVGSIDEIISPAELRPYLINELD